METLLWILSSISLIIVFVLLAIRFYLKCSVVTCPSTESMKGKVVIVTGANNGIGYYIARDLAKRSAKVILACRNENKAATARDKIIEETGNKNVVYKPLNLSSLNSVRIFAEDINKTENRIDVLINNAGISNFGDKYTFDAIVEEMQVNHFAPLLLTLLLIPILKKSKGRVINLNSLCHHFGIIDLEKINKAGAYSDGQTYSNSKLCNLMTTLVLARRLKDSGVTVNAVHPGVILTNIVPKDSSLLKRTSFALWCWLCCRTAEEGAQTAIYLAVADEVSTTTGEYFIDCTSRYINWKARNETMMEELTRFSEKLIGYKESVVR